MSSLLHRTFWCKSHYICDRSAENLSTPDLMEGQERAEASLFVLVIRLHQNRLFFVRLLALVHEYFIAAQACQIPHYDASIFAADSYHVLVWVNRWDQL